MLKIPLNTARSAFCLLAIAYSMFVSNQLWAQDADKSQTERYVFDVKGAHAFVQFRIKHLGYSWLYGRFNKFDGEFLYNEQDPSKTSFSATIDMTSLDSNHNERDKHLRSKDFLDVSAHPTAKFQSTGYVATGKNTGDLKGNLTLFGKTQPVVIKAEHVGGGKDPWGGYRQGFEGKLTIKPADFGKNFVPRLGQDSEQVELILTVEGIRQSS